MADKDKKLPQNAPGKYYVDEMCTACQVCTDVAPDHFRLDDEEGTAYVFNQPSTQEEKEECTEAMKGCPCEAIGNDGD